MEKHEVGTAAISGIYIRFVDQGGLPGDREIIDPNENYHIVVRVTYQVAIDPDDGSSVADPAIKTAAEQVLEAFDILAPWG